MERKQVQSSTIRSIGYSAEERILEVEFSKKTVYEYYKVPPAEYENLMKAKSHGVYFNANIRDIYKCNQLK